MTSPDHDILASARRTTARQQLQALLVVFAVGLALMLVIGLVLGERETLYLTGANALLLAAITWLRRRDRTTAAAFLATLALLATATWGAWTSRFGLLDSTTVIFVLAVVYGTLLLPNRYFLATLGLTILAIAVVGFRAQLGLATGVDSLVTQPIDVAVVSVCVILITSALRRQSGMLWDTLHRSVDHEQNLAASNEELQRRQEQIVASEQRFRSLVTAAPDWIVQLDRDGTIVFANREEYFAGGPLGRRLTDLVAAVDRARLDEALAAALDDGASNSVEVEASATDRRRRCVFHFGPLQAESGAGGAIVLVSDVTERRQLQEQFLQTQKLESIGQLAGGISHDFNNLLTVIGGHADLAQMKLDESDPVQEDLEVILSSCDHATALTRQILAFSRRQPLRPVPVDLTATLGRMRRMFERLIGEDIRLEVSLATDLPPIEADPGSVEQVVMNLLVNARDAIRDLPRGNERSVRLATRLENLDTRGADLLGKLQPGSYVVLSVQDTGVGMDETLQTRIFEPFFTTKETGRGTGLGLATVYGIVAQSGGTVRVESTPGAGANFSIYWPTTARTVPETSNGTPTVDRLDGDEHILVVEDDPAVRDLATLALRRHGYQVTAVSTGQQALDLVAAGHRFALVVSDVVMPGMNGFELRDRLPASLPVLLCSGHTDLSWLPDGALPPPELFLPKPYGPHDLARQVRHLLDAADIP